MPLTGNIQSISLWMKEAIWKRALLCGLRSYWKPGELTTRMPRRIKEGETICRVEAPRGELFYFIKSNGTDTPERVKVRTPTVCNMLSVLKLVIGHQLADMPMILSGIDPCFSCNDRVTIIDQHQKSPKIWTWQDLRQYGIEYYNGHSR